MSRRIAAVLAVALALGLGAALYGRYRVERTITQSREQVTSAEQVPFTLRALLPSNAAPVFQPLSTPARYTAGAAFDGSLWLAGPSGVAIYANGETSPKLLRAGLDLPAAPILSLASGRLRGEREPVLVASTRGAGLLLFGKGVPRQMLPTNFAAREITAVLPLGSGDLLLGTRSLGVLVYRGPGARSPQGAGTDGVLQPFVVGLRGLDVTTLAGDEGDLWVGTRDRGVLHWHAGQLDPFTLGSGLPDPQVLSLAVAPGEAFVGTPRGVARFHEGQPAGLVAPDLFARALAIEGERLLVGTLDQGLRTISLLRAPSRFSSHAGTADEDLQATAFLRSGDHLFALANGGLVEERSSGLWASALPAAQSTLADADIAALDVGGDGRLWVGYFNRGLDVLDPQTGKAQHLEDDHLFCVNRIVEDPLRHTVDVATANGLVLLDPSAGTPRLRSVLLRRDGLLADQVSDVAFTGDTTVLATPAGLTFLTPAGAEALYAFGGLVNNHVYSLAVDPGTRRLLAGTLGGLSLVEAGQVRRNLTVANSGLRHNWITALLPLPGRGHEASGYLVGTYGAGVMAMDNTGRVSPIEGATSPAVINPNALLRTPRHLFAGTLDRGLLVEDLATGRWHRVAAGLPSLNVTALAAHNGTVYIGTDNGLVQAEEARLP